MESKSNKEHSAHHSAQLDSAEFVRFLVTSTLNGKLDKKMDVTLCEERHKEVSKVAEKLDKLMWAIMVSLASTVGTLIILLFKTH